MGPKRKLDDLAQPSSSGGGGDDRPTKAPRLSPPPAQSPSRDQTAPPTSPPPLQPPGSPPPPADKDPVELEEGELEDDADSQEEAEDDQDSDEELGGSLPELALGTQEYLSLRETSSQFLDGKRTYLKPQKDCRILIGVFRCPDDRPTALGSEEQLAELVRESPDNSIIQEKMKILSKHYVLFRRTRQDGSCFYRAFLFSYMEILRQMQDKQAEVTRLMECLEMYTDRFSRLKWDKAYFFNPEKYFSSVVSELNEVLNVIAAGCTSEWLYKRSLQETFSGRIISFLRLLTETEIRTEEFYKQSIPQNLNVLQFCWKTVRSLDAEATTTQMRALTYTLGIPLRVEVVDKSSTGQGVLVKRLDFFHQADLNKGPLHLTRGYLSSSTAPKLLEEGGDDANLLSSDGAPLLTLLCRRGHCDILYRK
ncbi:hypothetical protein CFC21_021388 [Triticum aestivum]|uniref:Ubiquitinyl hydrolase 1 n=2 Tax=Triticum aestivum TaxID=4565 RepID=A0A3B6BYZ9_WHEAT|nr:OVARIAN TUMOR DOMAIN-containing deubiquitinating enzyme 1-like isoform X1 [Triticum aestivum]KAF7006339.1 hypothetical protein CFC21_021388 [Triticum aestivum]